MIDFCTSPGSIANDLNSDLSKNIKWGDGEDIVSHS